VTQVPRALRDQGLDYQGLRHLLVHIREHLDVEAALAGRMLQVLMKLVFRLLTEMLEVRILPGSQLLCHSAGCEHFQGIRPFDDAMSSARITINRDQ